MSDKNDTQLTMEELPIALDITTRIALFTMAKTCSLEEINIFFNDFLEPARKEYNNDLFDPLADSYKRIIVKLSELLKQT